MSRVPIMPEQMYEVLLHSRTDNNPQIQKTRSFLRDQKRSPRQQASLRLGKTATFINCF